MALTVTEVIAAGEGLEQVEECDLALAHAATCSERTSTAVVIGWQEVVLLPVLKQFVEWWVRNRKNDALPRAEEVGGVCAWVRQRRVVRLPARLPFR
jgi:hypothetical protein